MTHHTNSNPTTTKVFTNEGRELVVVAVSLSSRMEPVIPNGTEQIWKKLAPHIRHNRQVVFARDISDLSIEGKHPGGYAPNGHEVFVAVPSWPTDGQQWVDTLAHELHHVVRWQQGGYGKTLGEALVTEGLACWFAELESGWKAPWIRGDTSAALWKKAQTQWDDSNYKHEEWFLSGPLGKWVGYRMGYALVRRALDSRFDLTHSATLTERNVRPALDWLLDRSH